MAARKAAAIAGTSCAVAIAVDAAGRYAVLDVAASSGLERVPAEQRQVFDYDSRGLGEMIRAALDAGAQRLVIGIGGSSMGGLMSVYCIARYNRLFSRAACVSPTLDICMDPLTQLIQDSKVDPDTRVYIDFGSNEVKSKKTMAQCVDNILRINREFQKQHCSTFPNIVVGGTHSEASWETIVPLFLDYLFQEE